MIKAVFVDLDGTLLTSKNEISIKTQEEIKKCIKKGIKIILTSGRSRKEVSYYQKRCGTSKYIISSNGASVYDISNEKEIYNETLEKEIIYKLLEYSEKTRCKLDLNYKDKIVLNRAFYSDEKDREKSIEELKEIIENEKIVQCVISNPDLNKMQQFKIYFEKEFSGIKIVNESKKLKDLNVKPSKNYYCDIVAKNISKGNAVEVICEYLNIKSNEIITIGDGENDIAMFEKTENSVAMENALQIVKENAKYITASNDEDGVAKVLEKL